MVETRALNSWRVFPMCDQSTWFVFCVCMAGRLPPMHMDVTWLTDRPSVITPIARPTSITNMITDHFSQLIPPFANPVRHNKDDNFVMYLGEETAKVG